MHYESKKIKHRLVFIPDAEMKEVLRWKLSLLKSDYPIFSSISTFRKKNGLWSQLSRHGKKKERFFVIVDFCHAFHHVDRKMIAKVVPGIMEPRFDVCFVELNGKEIIPAGFPTSNYLFELFMSRRIDPRLLAWKDQFDGVVTRYADNILLTWGKNTSEAFEDLKKVFKDLKIRITPQYPRKWKDEPIRFCGLVIKKGARPKISRRKRKDLIKKAQNKSLASLEGVTRFVNQFQ